MKKEDKVDIYREAFKLAQRNLVPEQWLKQWQEEYKKHDDPDKFDEYYDDYLDMPYDEFLETPHKLAAPIFEKLKKTFDEYTIKQIDSFKNSKCHLLIFGKPTKLDQIDGIASYIYYKNKSKFFECIDCTGLSEGEVREKLFPKGNEEKLEIKLFTTTIYLKNLENYKNVLKRITGIIRDWEIKNKSDKHGTLIIGMNDITDLPEEFLEYFKIISLETRILFDTNTNKITVNVKNFPNIPDREYKLFKLLYDNQERYVTKREILEALVVGGEDDESQIFKLITSLRNTFKECPLLFDNIKKTKYKEGGYRLIIQD
ncbi:MAG: hypothetical protein FJY07_05795 [Bacteroidetes bacterium]|nr:hypothetical protein [Bacteroidota bacterium]